MAALPMVCMLIGSLLAGPTATAGPASRSASVTVYIRQTSAADAETYATAVSDPRSPLYRHFLSPAEYRARFAPGDGTVATVDDYLRGNGLTVEAGPANHLYVQARGTVAQVRRAEAVPATMSPTSTGSTPTRACPDWLPGS